MCKTKIAIHLVIISLGFFGGASFVSAATYYVDWDNGNDSTGNGSITTPWKTPWYAGTRISAGDTVIIHAKSDGSPYNNGTSTVINANVPNTTWKAATGEIVKLSITAGWGNTAWVGNSMLVVNISGSYVVLDGFYVWGQVHIGAGGDFSIIQNCDLSGGNGGRDNFAAPIYLHGSIAPASVVNDWTDGVRIYNNKIHDNVATSPETKANNPLMMFYGAKDTLIENNEFWGGIAPAVKVKDHSNGQVVRYNWFRDTTIGVQGCTQYCVGSGMTGITIYQNLFTNISQAALALEGAEFIRAYNNTFYKSNKDIYWWYSGSNFEFFNNIFYHSAANENYYRLESTWTIADFVYNNYNDFFSTSGVATNWYINSANRASTLSSWTAWLDSQGATAGINNDNNSTEADPGFLNSSGSFSQPSDFKRNNYTGNGRGSVWPTVMGAYITGAEVIGLMGSTAPASTPTPQPTTSTPSPTPAPDTTPPAPPTGLSVQVSSSAVSGTNECANWQTQHPEWIFCDDFESTASLTGSGRYFEYNSDAGDFIAMNGVGFNNSSGMRTLWQQAEVDAGNLKLAFGRNPGSAMDMGIRSGENFRDIYYRMYLKMQAGWQGNPGKLSRATIIAAPDWSQAMIAHLWNGAGNLLAIDPVSCVDANSNVKCVGYNNFANMSWLGARSGTTSLFDTINSNQWLCIEHHIKLNDPGLANGVQEFWINQNLEASRSDLDFIKSYASYGINAVFFENYWNAGSVQQQERYFDNIVVSTQRVGCF